MSEVWQMGFVLLFPVACLLLVLWLGRMEETLTEDVRRARRQPEPSPILRILVEREQPAAQTSEVSRSVELSLGGSTNL